MEYKTRGNGNKDPIILDVRPVIAPSVTRKLNKKKKFIYQSIEFLLAILTCESPTRSNASGNDASTRIE